MTENKSMHLDQSIIRAEDDRYGFHHVATQLAQSIQGIGREGTAVIGIEGVWGSGKTSMLNLLRAALVEQKENRTFVLNISPWLDGSGTSLVASLLHPVTSIIAAEEASRLSPEEQASLRQKKTMTHTVRTLMEYTRATARNLAPVAQAAAIIPGIPDASSALNTWSESRWLKEKEKTTAEMRSEIAKKIADLDLSFIILLDDLDRLEPTQAVEVIRLVKSVADFPRFRYVLCYDKSVLAQAICRGLGVTDGNLYLQKIVQIAFRLPRPERFVLRREFLDGAIRLYKDINQTDPGKELLSDLGEVSDIYGATLETPREVQLALNALRFRYSGIRDYIYLPDLCFLQLIRTTNPGLYDWVEEYLTVRAIVESGDGSISKEEKKELIDKLAEHLSRYFPLEAHSVWTLSHWVPGLSGGMLKEPVTLFNKSDDEEKVRMTMQKRMGSLAYWRYYFAFSAPQNVLKPADFDRMFAMAADKTKQSSLATYLLDKIHGKEISSRTWFEHILSQLTPPAILLRSIDECEGFVRFFFHQGDEITRRYLMLNSWFSLYDLDTYSVVDRLLQRMFELNPQHVIATLHMLVLDGPAWYWIAEYCRHLLWQHGLITNHERHEQEQWLPHEVLQKLRRDLADRLATPNITSQLMQMHSLTAYIWAWRDISSVDVVRDWVVAQIQEDESFLQLLLLLRYKGTSSASGRYRALKLSQFSEFLGEEEVIQERLERIDKEGKYPKLINEVNVSIQNNHF